VDVRLDQLVAILQSQIKHARRGSLAAALIHGAPETAEELKAIFRAYEDAPTHRTLLDVTETEGRYRLPPKPRGPRPLPQ
jgi:hypothetical protein